MNLKLFRESAGLTKTELSRRSGVPLRTIESWESRDENPLTLVSAKKIADTLGCTIENLIEERTIKMKITVVNSNFTECGTHLKWEDELEMLKSEGFEDEELEQAQKTWENGIKNYTCTLEFEVPADAESVDYYAIRHAAGAAGRVSKKQRIRERITDGDTVYLPDGFDNLVVEVEAPEYDGEDSVMDITSHETKMQY